MTTHAHLAPRLKKEQSYTSVLPLGHTGPVTGSLFLLIYKGKKAKFTLEEAMKVQRWGRGIALLFL